MNNRVLKVAIIGCGSRGADSYGKIMFNDERFEISALCDIRKDKLDRFEKEFNVPSKCCFSNEVLFFEKRLGDMCVVATQDKDHVRHAIAALKLGYDVLLEKPITPDLDECYKLLDAQKKYGGKVIVCHVLRYAPAYRKLDKLLLEDKVIGDIVNIHAVEQVGYWHQAHSFVRGNWRKEKDTSPMILAKCCHDLDLIQHYAQSKCKSVSSIGSNYFFNRKHQPEGASDRCQTCKYKETCPYSAYDIYLNSWEYFGKHENTWPQNVITSKVPLTREAIIEGIETTNYGQCVFACDNDVVDNQEVIMLFENGISANLLMTGFTKELGRKYLFHGTYGEVDFNEEEGKITVKVYGKPTEVIPFSSLADINDGHGGGDEALINDVYKVFALNEKGTTTLEESLESHIIAIKAEESRKKYAKV